jgi:hypothetical protein
MGGEIDRKSTTRNRGLTTNRQVYGRGFCGLGAPMRRIVETSLRLALLKW